MRITRRTFLRNTAALAASGLLAGPTPRALAAALATQSTIQDRILVVFELSGGNDGLNTVVPYGDDVYYKLRPTIGIKAKDVRKLDDHWGLNPGLLGFERLWQDGQLAIVHGCGYEQPSFSHFTSMAYWHTAAPNRGDEYGWYGRLADALTEEPTPNLLINIDTTQSLAVKSRLHTPVVFDEPERFQRRTLFQEHGVLDKVASAATGNASLDYLNTVARSAAEASALIRNAWANYQTPIDYGLLSAQFPKVAACINAGLPTRLYYLAYRNNAFDTHVQQPDLHERLLSYAGDAVHGFIRDLERLGVADRVAVLVFSEFGRRATENTNQGTDHGTANVMFLAGKGVRGGHYGAPPKLDALDEGDNLVFTTDFRRVYTTAIDGWLKSASAAKVLKGEFEQFNVFA
ncbi:MAG: DUF1501 domain-containing protein [Gammaproteobacteria bacterium]|nr:DUF1501 domain-containing protein [Gammaproteobacteria bacterium]